MPVKIVILWAGRGRRIQKDYPGMHKALIPLNGRPLLAHLLKNVERAGVNEIIPVLGFAQDLMLEAIRQYGSFAKIRPVINPDYEKTNNLASLLCAEELLSGEEFIVVNGDMVFDWHILADMAGSSGNAVATDFNEYPVQLDSPRVLIKNGCIADIGRHRTIDEADGYAIGIYRFAAESSAAYFQLGREITAKNLNAGYHEPIVPMLQQTSFFPVSTKKYRWMDVDEKADVSKAEALLNTLAAGDIL